MGELQIHKVDIGSGTIGEIDELTARVAKAFAKDLCESLDDIASALNNVAEAIKATIC